MFCESTQRDHWTFTSDSWSKYKESKRHLDEIPSSDKEAIVQYYLYKLIKFCEVFTVETNDETMQEIPLPLPIRFVAATYYSRFYLENSVLDPHPSDVLYTFVFLATKIEEFYVSIKQFADNIAKTCYLDQSNPEHAAQLEDNIENMKFWELPVIQKIKFHLTIYTPFDSIEGYFVLLRSIRSEPELKQLGSIESLKQQVNHFVMHSLFTDAIFLYPPSQLALCAVIHSLLLRSCSEEFIVNRFISSFVPSPELAQGVFQKIVECRQTVLPLIGLLDDCTNELYMNLRSRAKSIENKLSS